MGEAKRRRDRERTTGVERTDVAVNPERCPHCGKKMNVLLTVAKNDPTATPATKNSVVLCHHCTGVSIVDGQTRLVKFTRELVEQMDPRDTADIMLAVDFLRRRKIERGELEGKPVLLDDILALAKAAKA